MDSTAVVNWVNECAEVWAIIGYKIYGILSWSSFIGWFLPIIAIIVWYSWYIRSEEKKLYKMKQKIRPLINNHYDSEISEIKEILEWCDTK